MARNQQGLIQEALSNIANEAAKRFGEAQSYFTPATQGAANVQHFIQSPQETPNLIPEVKFSTGTAHGRAPSAFQQGAAGVAQYAGNFVPNLYNNLFGRTADIGLDIGRIGASAIGAPAQPTIPQYNQLKSPLARLSYNASSIAAPNIVPAGKLKIKNTPQEILGNYGGAVAPNAPYASGVGLIAPASKFTRIADIGKPNLLAEVVKGGAKLAPQGFATGFFSGLAKYKNENDVKDQLIKSVNDGKITAAQFFALGGALAAGKYALSSDQAKKIYNYVNSEEGQKGSVDLNAPVGKDTVTFYRGEGDGSKAGGNFFATDINMAKQYGDKISKIEMNANDIYDATKFNKPLPVATGDTEALTQAIADAKAQGFKGVMLDEGSGLKSLYRIDQSIKPTSIDASLLSKLGLPTNLDEAQQGCVKFGAKVGKDEKKNLAQQLDSELNAGKATPEDIQAALKAGNINFNEAQALGGGAPTVLREIAPVNKVPLLRQGIDRARNIIASQGEPGKQLASDLQKSRDVAEVSAGNWTANMPTVRKLTKDEFNNFVDVSEGKAQPINPKVSQAFNEWDQVRQDIYATAKQSGLDIGKIEDYFPHIYDKSLFTDKNKYAKAINDLVESGQAKDTTEAAKILRYAGDLSRNRRQGNLEFERVVDLPDFQRTKEALFKYVDSASNRISQTQIFGSQDENALKLINQIADQGGDASTVKDLFDISVGAKNYGQGSQAISMGLRKYNTVSKLGLGAITNAGQSVNTQSVAGTINTIKHIPGAAFSPQDKEFALRSGVTVDGVLQDLREGGGFEGNTAAKIGAPGFNVVERFNRTLAATAGRDYAKDLAAKGDTQTLAKMGIDLQGNTLTPEQEVQAARNMVERTQFKVDPQDLPGWATSPWGKVLAQFRTFAYNQSAFLGRELLKPAIAGNVAPLARFIAIGIPVGIGIQTLKNVIRNRNDEENPVKRVSQGFQQVGGYGLAGDIATGLFPQNSRYLDSNRATTLAVSTLGGPTLGTISEGYGATAEAVQGKPTNLERFVLRQIPIVGGTIQNTVLPYKTQSGESNRRFTLGADQAQAANESIPMPTEGVDYVGDAKRAARLTEINAKEKQILGDNGTNLFGWQMGGITDNQKNTQIAQLEAEKAQLEFEKKSAQPDYSINKSTAEYNLNSDRLKRQNDFQGWYKTTSDYVRELTAYQQTLNPKLDAIKITQLQNSIEDK